MSWKRGQEVRPIEEGEESDWVVARGPRPRAGLGLTISLRLDPALASRVRSVAEEDHLTLSEFVRRAVVGELDRRSAVQRVLPSDLRERLTAVSRAAIALAESAEAARSATRHVSVESGTSGTVMESAIVVTYGGSVRADQENSHGARPEKVQLVAVH